jgi:hypothetical protein
MADCLHEKFSASVAVGRLSEAEGGPITGFSASVNVKCDGCGLPFRFIGLEAGNHHAEPRVSIDGTELRAPIEPASHEKFSPRASYTMPSRIKQ